MPDGTWSLAQAETQLSEVVARAKSQGPQYLTEHGKAAAVVLSAEEYRRLSAADTAPPPPAWLDPRFRILSDEEHDEIFARDRDPGRVIEF